MRTLPSNAISLRGLTFFAEGFLDALDFIANGLELCGGNILDVTLGMGDLQERRRGVSVARDRALGHCHFSPDPANAFWICAGRRVPRTTGQLSARSASSVWNTR